MLETVRDGNWLINCLVGSLVVWISFGFIHETEVLRRLVSGERFDIVS